MKFNKSFLRNVSALVAAVVVGSTGLSMVTGSDETVDAVSLCSTSAKNLGGGGEYHPITPYRAFDSRVQGSKRPYGHYGEFEVKLTGLPGMPRSTDSNGDKIDDNVLAVWVNVTTTQQTREGYMQATPSGKGYGQSSIVNFKPWQDSANSSILRPGKNGNVRFRVWEPAGTTHVIVDVFGYFSSCNYRRGARVVPVGPARLFDTRTNNRPLGPRSTKTVQIRGVDSVSPRVKDIVPNDPRVTAVILNLTGVNLRKSARTTHVAAAPYGPRPGTLPSTSNLNLQRGQTKANLAIVPIASDGKVRFYNYDGNTDLVVDVVGYLREGEAASSASGRVVPLATQYRAIDTRQRFSGGPKKLGPGAAEVWSFQKMVGSVKVGGASVGPQAGMFANFTGTGVARVYPEAKIPSTHLSIYPPAVRGAPAFSSLNLGEGESVPNMSLVNYGQDNSVVAGGKRMCTGPYCVRIFNAGGFVDYVLDVQAVILK